jgi:hypothetical protein
MCGNSSEKVRLWWTVNKGPGSFCQRAGANPYFLVMSKLIAQLAPKSQLSSNDVVLVTI